MATKGNVSEIGSEKPTEASKEALDNLVGDVLAPPATSLPGPKSTLKEEKVPEESEGLDSEEEVQDQAEEQAPEQAESEEPSDEEVVPASKVKKMHDKMQKRIDALTQKLKMEESDKSQSKSQEDMLASLSSDELNELRDNTDEAIMDAKVDAKVNGTDVAAKVNELKTLRRNIDKTVKEAPTRFANKQFQNLMKMAEEVKEIDPNVVNKTGDLWATATRIYQRMPSLHRSETGQAEALAIATEYFLEKNSMDDGREKASTLSKKVASLKRKTTLDSKTRVASQDEVSSRKLRDKAIKGTYFDKLSYVSKTLVPDEFLRP